jgi:polysaccharide biosynthesis protein PslG
MSSLMKVVFFTSLFYARLALAEPKSEFGIALGDIVPRLHDLTMDKQALDGEFGDIAALNVKWIRVDMSWSDIQPKDDASYNWTKIDLIVSVAITHNIKVLPILDHAPRWARSPACMEADSCTPADPALFAKFAKAAALRYAPRGISTWEVWNEPNLRGSLSPARDASVYARLLKLTYIAIKSVQPFSTIIVGGLAPAATSDGNIAPIEFLAELYAFGAKSCFDALGFHPYSTPAMPLFHISWNAWQQMNNTKPSLRSVMMANGDAEKQIWITEYGAPTGGPGILEASTRDTSFVGHPDHVTEAIQEQMLSEAVADMRRYRWVGPFFWYSYKDMGTKQSTIENFFGLLHFDGTPKPAYIMLKALLSKQ